MVRFRKESPTPFTASQFRINKPNAISFSLSASSTTLPTTSSVDISDLPADETFCACGRTKTVSKANLALGIREKKRTNLIWSFILRPPTWLFTVAILLSFLMVRSWEQHLACILPSKISRPILHSGRQCDWHQTAFSHLIPFGRDFASLKAGGMVSSRLTTSGIDSTSPSTVLSNTTGACWFFRGNSGTFGVAFDVPNVLPSHVVIQHWPSTSTASLSRAPRQVIVWGLVDGEVNMRTFLRSQHVFTPTLAKAPPPPISKEGVFLALAEINFDITAQSLRQAFPLSNYASSWGIDFGVIVFDIRSNWGADITSLCTVHVYGRTIPVG